MAKPSSGRKGSSIRIPPVSLCLIAAIVPLLSACREEKRDAQPSRSQSAPQSAPPAKHVYALKDSFETDSGPMAYFGAVLYRDGEPLDTVFSGFGFYEVGRDTLLYQKLLVYPDTMRDSETGIVLGINPGGEDGGLHLYDQASGIRTKLSAGLPFYHAFSSPNVSAGSLLYWGVAKADTTFRIYAMRYGFAARNIDSAFLYNDGLGTDNTDYFPIVDFVNGTYVYPAADGSSIVLDSAFRRIAINPPPRQDSLARQPTLDP
jgi:hypothetical protein